MLSIFQYEVSSCLEVFLAGALRFCVSGWKKNVGEIWALRFLGLCVEFRGWTFVFLRSCKDKMFAKLLACVFCVVLRSSEAGHICFCVPEGQSVREFFTMRLQLIPF